MRVLGQRRTKVGLSAVVAVLAAALVLPAAAGAVLSGVNGKILVVSGRDATDATSRIYYKDAIGSQGGGAVLGPIAAIGGQQLRHPTWSPDRTKIAFAAGVSPCGNGAGNACSIYTLDVTNPAATPVRLTASAAGTHEDRPAWSPDGTKIAFEQESGATNSEIIVKEVGGLGNETNVTSPDPQLNLKPAWSPDSQFLYYSSGDPFTMNANTAQILRKPTSNLNGPSAIVVGVSGASQWQPSLSPDGTKMCFTFQGAAAATADLVVVPLPATLPPLGVAPAVDDFFATTLNIGEYNCTWSPDGTKIAYVEGVFGTGTLVQRSFPKDINSQRTLVDTAGVFDGNPDWAPDAQATCPDKTVSVPFNTPTSIPLSCVDNGPAYEQTEVLESIRDDPTKGTVGDVTDGTPSTVTYTPNVGFTGTDTFTYIGRDARSFGVFGTVTVNVQPEPPDTTKPDITLLRVRPTKIKRGNASMKLGVNTGRRISFTLSEDAAVTLKFELRTTGRRVGGKCRKRTNANKSRKKCTRYVSKGSRKFTATKSGKNSIRFQGRISASKRLALGRYRVSATAKDAAGNSQQQTRRKTFRLVKRSAS
jgi:Tol biopolymer transport system component